MTDIALIWDNTDFSADVALLGADLQTDNGLITAIIISLESDARAADDDVLPQPGGDKRGWWGDTYADVPGDVLGSKLWLLSRAKDLTSVFAEAEQYAGDALAWLVEDGVASAVTVTASEPVKGTLQLAVALDRPTGPNRLDYDHVWSAL